MHNGAVARWDTIKRALLFSIREKFFSAIQGSTDSELVLLSDSERDRDSSSTPLNCRHDRRRDLQEGDRQRDSPARARHRGGRRRPPAAATTRSTLLNFCFTDGDICCCTKFVHPADRTPASLYFTSGTEFTDQNRRRSVPHDSAGQAPALPHCVERAAHRRRRRLDQRADQVTTDHDQREVESHHREN
jgi:glutamine amidotransferase